MGIDLTLYRTRIGHFQLEDRYFSKNTCLCSLGLPLTLMNRCVVIIGLLLLVGNIERNPGPSTEGKWNESDSCTWNENDVLGRGATAVVYKARNKINGSVCAVKVFHNRISTHNATIAVKEMQILRSLKHPNIISIIAIEKERQSGSQVLVMDFCEGGSLYFMLEQPKYAFGFPEDEFLVVLTQLADGLQYLRQQDMIHRDIKPGNIIRFINSDGSSLYKLTDFGAARQLDEEEQFTSIYGTEEYLDPHMYERAVLRRTTDTVYDASVDIWSLGVTIYHVATGQLPFQPYGGRMNTITMHQITTEKAVGVISGIQKSENSPIEWSKKLPETCLLSSSLKSLITPVIAGLLESNKIRRSTFDTFFANVKNITETKVLKLFSVVHGANLRIYISKNLRYASVQEIIANETQISAREQLILYNNRQLCDLIDPMVVIDEYPTTIINGQLYLYSKEIVENSFVSPEIPGFPDFLSYVNYDRDSSTAKVSCSIAHYIHRWITILKKRQEYMIQAQTCLSDYLTNITDKIEDCFPRIYDTVEETSKRQNTFYSSFGSSVNYLDILQTVFTDSEECVNLIKDAKDKLQRILSDIAPRDVMQKAKTRSEEIRVYMSVLVQKIKDQQNEVYSCIGCPEEDNCIQRAKHLQTNISDIWSIFQKHKKQRELSPPEKFAHGSDRLKLTEYCVQLQSLVQGHCIDNTMILHNNTTRHTNMLIRNLQRTKKVDQNIMNVLDCQKKLSERVDKMETDSLELNTKLQNLLMAKVHSQPISIPTSFIQSQKASDPNLSSSDSGYRSMVDNLTTELDAIVAKSSDLRQVMNDNNTKLSSNTDSLQVLLKNFSDDGERKTLFDSAVK